MQNAYLRCTIQVELYYVFVYINDMCAIVQLYSTFEQCK